MSHSHILNSVPNSDPIGFWPQGNFEPKLLADFVSISKQDWGRIANVKPSTVRFDARIPPAVKQHMERVATICSLVAELFDNNISKTKLWLDTPNPTLGNISPKGMIRYGKYERVLKFVLLAKSETSPA